MNTGSGVSGFPGWDRASRSNHRPVVQPSNPETRDACYYVTGRRGLVKHPGDWPHSSYRYYENGEEVCLPVTPFEP